MADDYRVQLDIYNGPLDLLLYLIRREEVDIYDIPIARITDQYVGYVEMLRQIDPNSVGEFLVLAATLMEIKSRMLLPRPPAETPEEFVDPRLELVRQLLEYKKFKDAADQLHTAARERAQRFSRLPADVPEAEPGHIELENLHIWDLVEAFRDVMAKTGRLVAHEVTYDDTPISLHAMDILDRIQRAGGAMVFADIFEARTRSECIGLFLALLELVRQRRIRAEQEQAFSTIYIHLIDATPIEEPEEDLTPLVSPPGPPDAEAPEEPATEGEELSELPPASADYEEDQEGFAEIPDVPELPPDWTERTQSSSPPQADEQSETD